MEDAISLEVNPVDRPEGEDFDSSAGLLLTGECAGYDIPQ